MLGSEWNRAGIGWKGAWGSSGGDEHILNHDYRGDDSIYGASLVAQW